MEQTIALILTALIMGATPQAQAQEAVSEAPPQVEYLQSSLDTRFEECIKGQDCSTQEYMRLMFDMNESTRQSLQAIDRQCQMMSYNDCIMPQRAERERWHRMHGNMAQIMKAMETRAATAKGPGNPPPDSQAAGARMNKEEPAAGKAEGPSKRNFWWWQEPIR